ncbi:hypothetical protein PHYBLDRAFT_142739 [Phycomyces blakesleeanus NRRL 1555(-)]|uniref:Uncharacterized protein n=1 Tax=Phycomyces blakesleeanus (strain ATCC 8743b / DSM 1359 / FGSC 10004 / NBRC 33097 / NRRL 1555) TaxID=763407 RepID=A0A162PYS3_PHYB8|nr:hypothetical protein PHYBLDRAFT_142739 [Phycomyces blakesleeanus NRRL 1555(-)]OAD77237.1 hypothetical protein PHYBLDRAFT_142739 [Phycomyces blakesleeanus NRRL 1555(-)]|eukprot:XP_018295277.1 hypothetical protein PHYBLDRAFT_142739 [Phycomyces blakesleeanus NRRL 1555(-)]
MNKRKKERKKESPVLVPVAINGKRANGLILVAHLLRAPVFYVGTLMAAPWQTTSIKIAYFVSQKWSFTSMQQLNGRCKASVTKIKRRKTGRQFIVPFMDIFSFSDSLYA